MCIRDRPEEEKEKWPKSVKVPEEEKKWLPKTVEVPEEEKERQTNIVKVPEDIEGWPKTVEVPEEEKKSWPTTVEVPEDEMERWPKAVEVPEDDDRQPKTVVVPEGKEMRSMYEVVLENEENLPKTVLVPEEEKKISKTAVPEEERRPKNIQAPDEEKERYHKTVEVPSEELELGRRGKKRLMQGTVTSEAMAQDTAFSQEVATQATTEAQDTSTEQESTTPEATQGSTTEVKKQGRRGGEVGSTTYFCSEPCVPVSELVLGGREEEYPGKQIKNEENEENEKVERGRDEQVLPPSTIMVPKDEKASTEDLKARSLILEEDEKETTFKEELEPTPKKDEASFVKEVEVPAEELEGSKEAVVPEEEMKVPPRKMEVPLEELQGSKEAVVPDEERKTSSEKLLAHKANPQDVNQDDEEIPSEAALKPKETIMSNEMTALPSEELPEGRMAKARRHRGQSSHTRDDEVMVWGSPVGELGAVSYTHLTLPTKRIV